MESFTDRNGNLTRMTYCSCGDLETLVDPLRVTNTFFRDYNGRVTQIVYAGGTNGSVTYYRNRFGQVTNHENHWGQILSNGQLILALTELG